MCGQVEREMGQTVEGRFKRAERKARAVGRQAGRTVRDRKNPSGAAIARIRGNVTGPRGPEARKAKTCWLGAKPVDLPVICDTAPQNSKEQSACRGWIMDSAIRWAVLETKGMTLLALAKRETILLGFGPTGKSS